MNEVDVTAETVTLVCTDGHRVNWPADLWPRPDECPVRMDPDDPDWHCSSAFWPGKLVPDEEAPSRRSVTVNSAQVRAAQTVVRRAEEKGETPSDAVRKVANAKRRPR